MDRFKPELEVSFEFGPGFEPMTEREVPIFRFRVLLEQKIGLAQEFLLGDFIVLCQCFHPGNKLINRHSTRFATKVNSPFICRYGQVATLWEPRTRRGRSGSLPTMHVGLRPSLRGKLRSARSAEVLVVILVTLRLWDRSAGIRWVPAMSRVLRSHSSGIGVVALISGGSRLGVEV
uniref:(northern house mosquito) hypothetical protein n=1 Tax=Culex pipiens TaxID=7175 RepID=A0A8D8AQP6_CULPI